MSLGFKAISLISAIGGCAGVPWFLKKMNEQNTNITPKREEASQISETPLIPSVTRKLEKLIPATEFKKDETPIKENCRVIDVPDLDDILYSLGTLVTYIPVFCEEINKDSTDRIPSKWKGLFPDYLFVNKETLNAGKGFEMTTETAVSDNGTETIFDGRGLHSPITGGMRKRDFGS